MTGGRAATLFATLLAVVLSAVVATPTCTVREDAPVVDTALMAFLSEARALHHLADLHKAGGDHEAAAAAMERLVALPRPHPPAAAPEIDEVLADTYARLAELRLETNALDAAEDAAHRGLAHAPGTTYFRGHLLEIEGLVEGARARALHEAGDEAGAARARARATQLLEEVIAVQDAVIRASLPDGGAP